MLLRYNVITTLFGMFPFLFLPANVLNYYPICGKHIKSGKYTSFFANQTTDALALFSIASQGAAKMHKINNWEKVQ